MTTRLGLWLLLSAAGFAYAFWVYRRRELPVRARTPMALLRGGSLMLVLLLLLDLPVPWRAVATREWTLLDASASMRVPQGDDARLPLVRALEARSRGGEALLFGSPVHPLADGTPGMDDIPEADDSRLAPALTRALEAGASRVTVLTDLRLQDPVEVAAAVRGARVPVTFEDLGGAVVNGGVEAVVLPSAARAGEEVTGEAALFGAPPAGTRLVVEVGGAPVWDTVVAGDPGRVRVPFSFSAPDSAGPVAVTVRLQGEGDVHPHDDARTAILEVDPDAGELVLVSWTPDWEPRFLLPVLEEVTGLRGQGYLRVGEDRFMTMNGPVDFADGKEVAAALEEARLAVAHGFPSPAPQGFARALERAPRLLTLPGSAGPGARRGEWYLSAQVPPSPLAGEIAGLPLLGLPPLLGYRADAAGEGGTPLLHLQLSARGEAVPGLLLRETPERRRVEATAHGFWRWGFRPGPARELYRRLWSGAAGWLLAGGALREVGMAPLATAAAPGEALGWRAGPAAGGRLAVAFAPAEPEGAGGALTPDTVPVDSLGRARIPAPAAPGLYRWTAAAVEGPGEGRTGEGLLVVQTAELDLLPPRATDLLELRGGTGEAARSGGGRPLRTHPLPYLLLLGFLFAEWVVRRRTGLR